MPDKQLRSAKEDALNKVEADMMLAACNDLLDNLTVRLPLVAGMRIGEVQHLRSTWLDEVQSKSVEIVSGGEYSFC